MSIKDPRILSLFAAPLVGPNGNPLDTLDVQKERDTLVRELGACNRNVTLRVGTATVDELSRGIADGFNILHFSGHGHEEFLAFEDGKGGSHAVTGEFLKKLIGTAGPFELAIVSACHSEKTGALIVQAGVRHVVAIRQDVPVLDSAAIVFIGEFFRHLFRRVPIQRAFELGRLLVEGNPQLTTMKPQLETMALIEGKRFVPEEEKFVLLPASDPSHHLVELVAEEVAEGVVTVEESRLSRTNLPTRPGVFTGRSREIFDLANEVLATRLVTITGAGGIGKTAVAREVARWFHSRGHFPDGVISIDLRQAETIEEIIAMLGASLEAEFSDIEDVVRYLRERQCLLLFDNAEEALWREQETVQGLINEILEHTPKIKLLITSQREVGGNLHEPELVYRLRTIEANYAAMLFVVAAKRRISIEEMRSEAFDTLLNELGGHPLSIVLMARQLGPGTEIKDILERIEKQKSKAIEIRSITDRDPEHGESLVASLSAAYRNLSEEGKRAFGALTMMPAGSQDFTIRQVLGDGGWESALEINDASLAEIIVSRRVILIPPVRLFAASVLTDELKEELGPKILRAMAGYAGQFYQQMGTPDARQYRAYFALEQANFLAATQLPCSPPETDKENSLLGVLATFLLPLYLLTDRHKDARRTGERLVADLQRLGDKLGQASTLQALGDLAVRTDDLKDAKDKYDKALEIFEQIDAKLGQASTLKALGDLAVRTDDLKDAKDKYDKALEIFEQIDAKLGQANTLQALGDLAVRTDDLKDAKDKYDKALEIFEQIDEKLGQANTLHALGDLAVRTDDLKDAKDKYDKALEIFEQIDAKLGQASTLQALGDLAVRTDDLKDAKDKYDKALEIFEQIDAKLGQANTLQALGDLAVRTDDLKDAKDKYDKALEIFEQIDTKLGQANTLHALGDLAVRTDDLKDAKDKYDKALEIFEQIDAKLGQANTLQALGDLAVRTDDLKDAKDKYDKALEIFEQIDEKLGQANTLRSMSQLSALESELDGADSRLNEASKIYAEINELGGKSEVALTKALVLIQRLNYGEARGQLDECSNIRKKAMGYGQAADLLLFYSDNLKAKGLEEGAAICLEYAQEFASKAADIRLIKEIEKRLGQQGMNSAFINQF